MDALNAFLMEIERDEQFWEGGDGQTILYVLIIILVILAIVYLAQRIR